MGGMGRTGTNADAYSGRFIGTLHRWMRFGICYCQTNASAASAAAGSWIVNRKWRLATSAVVGGNATDNTLGDPFRTQS